MAELPITREQAVELLKSMPQKESNMNHYLESESIIMGVAEKVGISLDELFEIAIESMRKIKEEIGLV